MLIGSFQDQGLRGDTYDQSGVVQGQLRDLTTYNVVYNSGTWE